MARMRMRHLAPVLALGLLATTALPALAQKPKKLTPSEAIRASELTGRPILAVAGGGA